MKNFNTEDLKRHFSGEEAAGTIINLYGDGRTDLVSSSTAAGFP